MADQQSIPSYVVSDSQAACRMYLKGLLPWKSASILGRVLHQHHGLVWCPAHTGQAGSELAHCFARELTGRDLRQPATGETDFSEILPTDEARRAAVASGALEEGPCPR
ncbi:hypothetical protein HPB50_013222 [Hyalomma asiaticum]|uniref:Uncharacterized protein n=1 Tax=Hyalomma asiaticum TaxID=266040 RepID=A0ACB7THG0_HYAAI|nr:hypothetical protein HPB50_013222 [Hyalomma asiaticum]